MRRVIAQLGYATVDEAVAIDLEWQRIDQVRSCLLDEADQRCQMVRKPKVVVVQIGDEAARCELKPSLLGPHCSPKFASRLTKRIRGSANSAKSSAVSFVQSVANNDVLPVLEGLSHDGLHSASQDVAAVIGGGDNRD